MREGKVPTKSKIIFAESEIVSMKSKIVSVESGRVSEWQEIKYELININ
jgi:hypothetical protein